MIPRFLIAFVLVALVCGGIVGFNMFRDQAIQEYFANMPVAPITVSTVKVEPIEWTPGIEAIGTVAASRGVDLTVEAAGDRQGDPLQVQPAGDAGRRPGAA